MSRKNNLKQFRNIVNGDMSQASITSAVTDIQFLDNIGIQLDFSGSPVGTFDVQISLNYSIDNLSNTVISSGTWVTIASGSTSGGSPIFFDLNQLSAPFIRVVYTKTSGTGTLNSIISAKML